MAKARKSPQQKKHLEYTKDHFTSGWHSSRMFPKTWKRKKARVNREYRRKSQELLVQAKPGIAANDVELIAGDLTAAHFRKSVVRKRLHKTGTVTVGEKVKQKLERREEAAGRKGRRLQHYDRVATRAISALLSLNGEQLVDFVRRVDLLCRTRSELRRVGQSKDRFDQALYFLFYLAAGSTHEIDALRRNQELDKTLGSWLEKAMRILKNDKSAARSKIKQRQATKQTLKVLRNRLPLSEIGM